MKTTKTQEKSLVIPKRPRRVSIASKIFEEFEKLGLEKVTLERCLELAQGVKPDTKFDKWHFYYYRKVYRDKVWADEFKKSHSSKK